MVAFAQPEQAGADERPASQVEGPPAPPRRPAAWPRPRGGRRRARPGPRRRASRSSDSAMTCTGRPSTIANVVRSVSCRRTISWKLRRSASASSGPSIRTAAATLKVAWPGDSWSRNQSACCANESGNGPDRSTRPIASAARPRSASPRRPSSSRSASAATVVASKSIRSGTSIAKASRSREATCVASSEWPPSSKKSSRTPTRSSPSTAAQSRRHRLLGRSCAGRRTPAPTRGGRPRARAGPCGPPCRWASAAARRARRTPTAPCTRATSA